MSEPGDGTAVPSSPLLAASAMCSGVALVAVILWNGSLPLTLAALTLGALAVGWWRWRTSGPAARGFLRRQVITGLLAGVAATLAYDTVRLVLYAVGDLAFFPLEALRVFGGLLLGVDASSRALWTAGALYHVFNGVTFALAYALLAGGSHWSLGVAWGLGLEAAMVTLYPSWLDLDAVRSEFLTLSLTGHVAYGAVLGWICQRRLRGATRSSGGLR